MMSGIHKEARKKATREAILSTALQLIHEKGINRLSLREIARRLEYSPAGLYEYFDSKAEIIHAVRLGALERFQRALSQVPPTVPYPESVVQLGMSYVNFARRYPQEFLLLFTHLRGDLDATPSETEMSRESYRLLSDAVQRGIDEGLIHTHPDYLTSEAAFSFWALVHGIAMFEVSYQHQFAFEVDNACQIAIRALARGLVTG
jgi:AcrR family transcriptional regulator